jgi:hypothetical protein
MITAAELLKIFEYRDGQLYWKIKSNKNKKIGDKAGTLSHDYEQIRIKGKIILTHRIIFAMHNGYYPKIVDHINGIKNDNRIENLRECTQRENTYNQKLRKNNNSGYKNVSLIKNTSKWKVEIRINGVKKHFGCFDNLELANLVAEEARNKYHGEFARHN